MAKPARPPDNPSHTFTSEPLLVRFRTPILLTLAMYVVLDVLALLPVLILGQWLLAAVLLVGIAACLGAYKYVQELRP